MAGKKYSTLTTPEYDSAPDGSGWDSVYPRPQLRRDSFLSLSGEWSFALSDSPVPPETFTEKIRVPFPPESLLSGVERRVGKRDWMIYKRTFSLPEGFRRDRVILHFGAVDQICAVFINGLCPGRNEGGYIPFSLDITEALTSDEAEILVIARDTLDKRYPYGKQKNKRGGMWYTPVSGIWQPVWLESVSDDAVRDLKINATDEYADITVISSAKRKVLTLSDGETYEFEGDTVRVEPKSKRRWTPDDPYLYEFSIETENDRIESYFALRKIEILEIADRKRVCLNGEPIFISALLDQGYYPDGIFLPATPIGYERDITLAKEMGFNALRKHIKIEPMIFYHLCDKLGMIVMQDMVNNGSYSFLLDTALPTVGLKWEHPTPRHRRAAQRDSFLSQMEKTAELLRNSPSVLIYTVFNEGWGQFSADEVFLRLKATDPTRLADATSGWFYGKESDFNSMHIYFKAPRIEKDNGKAMLLSEFGGFSLRCDGHLFGSKNYGYSLCGSEDEFTQRVYKLYVEQTLPLIKDGLVGTVYTQLTDVEDETNGLITYDRRKLKIDGKKMKLANEMLALEHKKVTK